MNSTIAIPKDLRRRIDRELQPAERVRWMEQPVPRLFTAASIATFLFGIPWTSFAVFWMWGAAGFEAPDLREGIQPQHLFALFGVPFVLIGLGMLSSPYWMWRAARNTVYLITDKRAIAIEGGHSTVIRSFYPDQLQNLYRREQRDGSGDVIITTRHWKDNDGDRHHEDIGFKNIRNPQEAQRLLQRLAEEVE